MTLKYSLFVFLLISLLSPLSVRAEASSNPIWTENKSLNKKINRYFKKNPISRREIQKFLLKRGYYRSEVVKIKDRYVVKNPIQTIFVFQGNQFFSEKDLRQMTKVDESRMGSFFYSFVEKALKSTYQSQGFLKVKIKKQAFIKRWKEWIYLKISEGPRVRIAELRVKGLLSKPNSEYENFIRNNSTALVQQGFYSKKALETGQENLVNYLKSEGYLQSKIYSDRIFFEEDRAFVTIHLEEGPLTLIRDIQIQNAKEFPVWEILSHMQSKVQSSLKIDRLNEDLESIENLYKNRGYLNIKILNKDDVIQYKPGERYASIVISLEEGSKAFVSGLELNGLKRANEKMVKNLLKFNIGDILTPKKKEQSIQALGATGLWTDIGLDENWKGERLNVSVNFQERKPRSFRGGFGVNSERGLTTRAYSEVSHRNLFGWGRALIARGSGQINFLQGESFTEYEMSGRYKEVFVPGYGYQGDISLTQSRNIFNYSEDNINFVKKTQISFFINKDVNPDLRFRWNVLSFENRTEACTQVVCEENPQRIGSSGFNTTWDKRDNIFDPQNGVLSSFQTEWAFPFLGSSDDISFFKVDLQNQIYWTFIKDYTLAFTLKGGLIQTILDSQYLPVSRSFILGGQSSIRGYDGNIEGERIPDQKSAPLQTANEALQLQTEGVVENALNSLYGLLNVNLRFPLMEGFKGVLFYDWGSVYLKGENKEVFSYGHSLGLGFRYQTFLIPIGLDIAYKLSPKDEELNYRFHFSVGW